MASGDCVRTQSSGCVIRDQSRSFLGPPAWTARLNFLHGTRDEHAEI